MLAKAIFCGNMTRSTDLEWPSGGARWKIAT
jgi:hypothetical protein